MLVIAKLHLQKVPVVLSSPDSSDDGEAEEPEEEASSICLRRQNFRWKSTALIPLTMT